MSDKKEISVGYVITNPFTGRPIEKTPDGLSLKEKVFSSKEDLKAFVDLHWSTAVFISGDK